MKWSWIRFEQAIKISELPQTNREPTKGRPRGTAPKHYQNFHPPKKMSARYVSETRLLPFRFITTSPRDVGPCDEVVAYLLWSVNELRILSMCLFVALFCIFLHTFFTPTGGNWVFFSEGHGLKITWRVFFFGKPKEGFENSISVMVFCD